MPPRKNSDRIDDLTQLVHAALKQNALQAWANRRIGLLEHHVDQLRMESLTLRHELTALRDARSAWVRREWDLVLIVAGAAVGVVASHLTKP